MSKKEKLVYEYQDELNDDFANNNIKTKKIANNYKYINKSWLFRFNAFWLRYLVGIPCLWIANTFIFRPKFVNKKLLKSAKKNGYFIYANHVLPYDPVMIPVMVNTSKKCLILAGPDLFSINGFVSWIVRHFYAIPVPNNDITMIENFNECISYYINKRYRVLIYPEAHIWPYYTGIRKFKSASFRYPVIDNVPILTMTTTFKKRKGNRKPKPVIYIDGPFYPDESLSSTHDKIEDLAQKAYETMKYRSSIKTNYSYIKYVKKSD